MFSVSCINKMLAGPYRLWRRFSGNRKGVAGIEFAVVFPIMVILFIGTVELSQAISVDRRINKVAGSTADLIARNASLTTQDLDGIVSIAAQLMQPYTADNLNLVATNVITSLDNANDNVVCWSYSNSPNADPHTEGSSFALQSGLLKAGEGVVVVEIEYLYTPPLFSLFIPTPFSFTETVYLPPRMVAAISLDNNECVPPGS